MPGVTTLGPFLRWVVAPNPGPMTLEGTNTYLIGDPTRGAVVVVDPGPLHGDHLERIVGLASNGVAAVVLTHRHLDHSEAASALAARTGSAVRAADPALVIGPDGLRAGDRLRVAGAELVAVSTPGHTADSMSLLLRGLDGGGENGRAWLLTGDAVLGHGTTVIAAPDGDLGDYLASLDALEATVLDHGVDVILPGHGPLVSEPLERLRSYRRHRLERLGEVQAAVAAGARTPAEVVTAVYTGLHPALRAAAEQSVTAQLDYLSTQGSE